MHEPSQNGGCLAVSSLPNVRNITTCLKIHNVVAYIFPGAPCSSSVRLVRETAAMLDATDGSAATLNKLTGLHVK
jgi:hypothetical protein